jgi:hypothetical protein
MSCDIVHIGINAAVKPAAFIFRADLLKTETAVFSPRSVGIYETNYISQVPQDPNLNSPLGYTIHNAVQGVAQQVFNEISQQTANYAFLLTTSINNNNKNNNKVQSYFINVALYYPPIRIQTSW